VVLASFLNLFFCGLPWAGVKPGPPVWKSGELTNLTTLAPFVYIKLCPSINKEFSTESFLDWEANHWVFTSRLQTPAADLLRDKDDNN